MTVQELLMSIHNKEFNLEKRLEVKKYLPIETKKVIAQAIIYDCTEDDGGAIRVDSLQRHMSYMKYMITMHTNLQYTNEDYDALCSTEYAGTTLLNAIVDMFEIDANECMRILDLMMDDYMQEMSVDFAVAKFLNKLSGVIDGIAAKLNEKVDGMDLKSMIPEDLDVDKLNAFMEQYIK